MSDIRKKVLEIFKPPFIYLNGWIFDKENNPIMQIRGWGHITTSMLGDFEAIDIQDELGKMVMESLNEKYHE